MERNHFLFLLLALPLVCKSKKVPCPSLPDKNLTCYNDYNRTITCEWNSTCVTDGADSVCTVHAEKAKVPTYRYSREYNSSCVLEPVDIDRPTLKKCSMVFQNMYTFLSRDELTIALSCTPVKESYSISYRPACHIKLNPPPEPVLNFTTVSWFCTTEVHTRLSKFITNLQWKQADQSWSHPSIINHTMTKECTWKCTSELNENDFIKDERYEARIRIRIEAQPSKYLSTWSDWSPTASWVSPIGSEKPKKPDVAGGVLGAVACVVGLAFALILLKTDRTTWIYMVKKIRGPPLPNPKFVLQDEHFQTHLTPYFTSESFQALLKPLEISSVEVTSTVDAVTPSGLEAALLEKIRIENIYESTSSSFSNPSYSQVSPPLPPVSSLTAGNLAPCGADTPYGPVASQSEEKNAEQDREEVTRKEEEIRELLSKGSNNTEPMLVISDYEKVEKPPAERVRLQSLDSGVCSGEEVSQESLEADSINISDCNDEGPEGKEEREGGNEKEEVFQRLFGGTFDKGSIQVSSDYERVQALQADCPELSSLDSGVSSRGEEQLSQESLEDVDQSTESTSLPFHPPLPPSALACSLHSFTPIPLNILGPGWSPALRPLPCHILERVALMSTGSVDPSGDGYMPKQNLQSS